MNSYSRLTLSLAVCCAWSAVVFAAERVAPAPSSLAELIDQQVDRALAADDVKPVPLADDANLVRRLTLDLAGRIPTTDEVQSFVASTEPDKKQRLIERLFGSPEFLAHQVNEFDALLMFGTSGNLREYLTAAFTDGRGWDRIFTELMYTGPEAEKTKGAEQFLKARVKDTDRLTNDVSVLFFGVNISCTQCHDHPLVDEWKQAHFYGLKSFFNRTFENGGFVAEREYGLVSYKTPKGEDRQASLMFLTGAKPEEPATIELTNDQKKAETKQLKEWADKKVAPPSPKFSRRAQLVEVALKSGENKFFARSIVNRIWYRLMGYGLVMPLDQLEQENTASHPELLDRLANELVEHHYDLTRVVRGIVSSKTYARSSRWSDGDRPDASLFACAQVRPLSPLQLSASLRIATDDPKLLASSSQPAAAAKRLESLVTDSRGMASLFDMPQDNFQIGTTEPLLFSNAARIESELLVDRGDRLVGRLKQLSTPTEQVNAACWAVLSRAPTQEEMTALVNYLKQRQDRPVVGLQQVVWALVSSAEFRFNY